ncbi:hypothetical protein [Chitinophaga rhizosphaerae]|uniref:hypothetical protein n=1 Tax=Chitinophaga rhizosphaerae TaxID=1864947 RepID=UPI000F801955|nr:hypothetical protein [Chitinophaga rhizosphaerae]
MYYMSSLGLFPRADAAIVSDPGRERMLTYDYLEHLLKWQEAHNGIPIIVRREKNLFDDLLNPGKEGKRFASIPAFTMSSNSRVGMLRRQCTSEYKIRPIDNAIRDLYGLTKGQRRPETTVWKGITTDELDRMDHPRQGWKTHIYPFTGFYFKKEVWGRIAWGNPMSREQVVSWLKHNNFPVPVKSACVFCPYRSDSSWADLKENYPDDFQAAVAVDESIRNSMSKGIKNPCYLHRSLKPLSEIQFRKSQDLWAGDCSSNCHL